MKKMLFTEKNVQRFAAWVIVSRGEKTWGKSVKRGQRKTFQRRKRKVFTLVHWKF